MGKDYKPLSSMSKEFQDKWKALWVDVVDSWEDSLIGKGHSIMEIIENQSLNPIVIGNFKGKITEKDLEDHYELLANLDAKSSFQREGLFTRLAESINLADMKVIVKYFKVNRKTNRTRLNQKVWIRYDQGNYIDVRYRFKGNGRYINARMSKWAADLKSWSSVIGPKGILTVEVDESFAKKHGLEIVKEG